MANFLPKNGTRRYQALYTANNMINDLVSSKFSLHAQKQSHLRAEEFFREPNANSQMTLYAMGNCHIDTAWLWRYQETRRKCARSWSAAIQLVKKFKNMTFVFSQAQQLVWVKEHYPTLYKQMQIYAEEGRFVGVGGAWVEMDGNLPSGESMIRQLLYGQQEFKKFCGYYSHIFWLPDTFGYSAQLPQIMQHCGMQYFVTQKMSWSIVNKFPHHSFHWFGLDGSSVIAHFPPHHYVSQITVKECLESRDNFTDRGRSNIAMMLYGFGDGGGGPDENMLKRAKCLVNCDGVPRVHHATPNEFFRELAKDFDNLCSWKGELFLELHNATYTTQAFIKKMNRLLESILRDHELLQSMSLLERNEGNTITSLWQRFLLNQFHDVLPGTCLKEVVTDAIKIYKSLLDELTVGNERELKWKEGDCSEWVLNSCSWTRTFFHDDRFLQIEPLSINRLSELHNLYLMNEKSLCLEVGSGFFLENHYISAYIDKAGRVGNMVVRPTNRLKTNHNNFVVVPEGSVANQFVIFDDVPLFWDAWDVMDYHLETKQLIHLNSEACLIKNTQAEARIRVEFQISEKSSIVQYISLFSHLPYLVFNVTVQWHESHKFLKVEFPVNVQNMDAYYDIQYGHVKRPTHQNTSWDAAKYEVVGHKWMVLSEFDHGAALLNDCKYGHSCIGNTMTLSLLRASKIPDDTADMGEHNFSYAFYPFIGSMQRPWNDLNLSVMRAAYEFNNPIRFVDRWSSGSISSFLIIDGNEGVIIDCVKPAENNKNALVVRLFESFGGKADIKLKINHPHIISIDLADGLERSIKPLSRKSENYSTQNNDEGFIILEFRAFEVKTLLLRLSKGRKYKESSS
ncbi:unnamed protein product [Thelazia callipaeda]|uniref:alpha-mannosidase n=1 Tax=Thelazia callipaeda TaxID=103827 RepID=A0A0N5CS84_THECL|nr:unnamed protein product [Thelazia callipaeda]